MMTVIRCCGPSDTTRGFAILLRDRALEKVIAAKDGVAVGSVLSLLATLRQ